MDGEEGFHASIDVNIADGDSEVGDLAVDWFPGSGRER